MKWQQFLAAPMAASAADLLVWRGSGEKSAGCGCTSGCARGPAAEVLKKDAVR